MKKLFLVILLFPILSTAQWKGNSEGNDQKSNMIKYYI